MLLKFSSRTHLLAEGQYEGGFLRIKRSAVTVHNDGAQTMRQKFSTAHKYIYNTPRSPPGTINAAPLAEDKNRSVATSTASQYLSITTRRQMLGYSRTGFLCIRNKYGPRRFAVYSPGHLADVSHSLTVQAARMRVNYSLSHTFRVTFSETLV